MVFLIESLVLIVLFSAIIMTQCLKDPMMHIQDCPPAIVERAKELGLPMKEESRHSKAFYVRKGIAVVLAVALLALMLVTFNKAQTFWQGFLLSYGLWLVVDWYDALILDCVWFCHSKKVRIPGTEDMDREYKDYWFHIKASLRGMLLGLPVCVLVGFLVAILGKAG